MIFFEQNYFFEYYNEKEQIDVPAQLITLIPFVNPSLYLNLKLRVTIRQLFSRGNGVSNIITIAL